MKHSPLERIVRHEFRLDMLCCVEQVPLTVTQICARTGRPPSAVVYHLRILEGGDLVGMSDDGSDVVYVATLDHHPAWVTEIVRDHAQAD